MTVTGRYRAVMQWLREMHRQGAILWWWARPASHRHPRPFFYGLATVGHSAAPEPAAA